MSDIISICGDNCSKCPRYIADTPQKLEMLAKLWYRIGWRDKIVPAESMRCSGCGSSAGCTYGLLECARGNSVEKCTDCAQFPCEKISALLKRSGEYRIRCAEICSDEEFRLIDEAFFNKERNLGLDRGESDN